VRRSVADMALAPGRHVGCEHLRAPEKCQRASDQYVSHDLDPCNKELAPQYAAGTRGTINMPA
jgi:hypothetical protein